MARALLVRLLVAGTVFATTLGAAATLGGINGSSLGADSASVASCDANGVTTTYDSAWDATDKRYEVTTVTVGGVDDACDGKTVKVTVTDSADAQITQGELSIPTSAAVSHAVPLSVGADAEAVTGVHVTIG
jgi:hypothetical protein